MQNGNVYLRNLLKPADFFGPGHINCGEILLFNGEIKVIFSSEITIHIWEIKNSSNMYTVEHLKTDYVQGQINQPVFRGTAFRRFRKIDVSVPLTDTGSIRY
jgi:hypothetical protein